MTVEVEKTMTEAKQQKEYRFVYRFKYTNDDETRKYQIYATKPLPRGLDPQTLVDWPHPSFEYVESEHVQGMVRISDFFDNLKKLDGYSDVKYSKIERVPKDRLRLAHQTPIELSTYYPDQIKGKPWSSDKENEFKYAYRFTCTNFESKQRSQVYGNKSLPRDIYPEHLLDGWQTLSVDIGIERFCESVRRNLPGYENFNVSNTPSVAKDELKIGFPYPIELITSLL